VAYTKTAKPEIEYTKTDQPEVPHWMRNPIIGWLLKQDTCYLLLETGGRIGIGGITAGLCPFNLDTAWEKTAKPEV